MRLVAYLQMLATLVDVNSAAPPHRKQLGRGERPVRLLSVNPAPTLPIPNGLVVIFALYLTLCLWQLPPLPQKRHVEAAKHSIFKDDDDGQ